MSEPVPSPLPAPEPEPAEKRKRHWLRWALMILVLLLVAGLVAARMYLPVWAKEYVNRQINSVKGYEGGVEEIDIHLWRGAYSIQRMKINKTGSGIPVPFVAIRTLDLSIQWSALFHGRIVSEIDATQPVLNFATNKAGTNTQTGKGVDWTQEIKKLMPIEINRVGIHDGTLAYRNFSTDPKVNVNIRNIQGEVSNLRNVEDEKQALPSRAHFTGRSIGGGKFNFDGRMNILKQVPDLDFSAKLEGVSLPALNDYFMAFVFFDVESGEFDVYSELKVKDGAVSGYVKPIARHISLIDLNKDSNPLKLLWESIASGVIEIFSNQRKDQFATRIPLRGNIKDVKTSIWPVLGGILRNAFVQALRKGTDSELGIDPERLEKQQ